MTYFFVKSYVELSCDYVIFDRDTGDVLNAKNHPKF